METKKVIFLSIISLLYIVALGYVSKIYLSDRYYNKALALEKNGGWFEAISFYEKAISTYPKNVTYFERLARLYFLRSWFPLNRKKFLMKAEDTIEKGLSLCTQSGELWLLQGMVSEGLSKKNEAIASYKQAIALDPHNAFYHTAFSTFYFKEGMEREGIQEAKRAISCYNKSSVYNYLKKMGIGEKTLKKIKESF